MGPEGLPSSPEFCASTRDRVTQILQGTAKETAPVSLGDIRAMARDPAVPDDEVFVNIVRLLMR